MTEAPDAVLLYIPLMKHLGMSWEDIKKAPRWELEGLLEAYNEHETLHSMDGYTSDEVAEIAKNRPQIRHSWASYQEKQAKFDAMIGKNRKVSFDGLM